MQDHGHLVELSVNDASRELHAIADWWCANAIDSRNGGFVGEIDFGGRVIGGAGKGVILNSRLLWFFSELSLVRSNPAYRAMADRAYQVIRDSFTDKIHSGVFWEIGEDGLVVSDKKQTYAICFCIYGLASYYALTKLPEARALAREFFDVIEARTPDRLRGGYIEAFARNWRALDDMRLGDDDLNAPKSMNTHLHLLEAYTCLHRYAPDARTNLALRNAIRIFRDRIVDAASGHLRLYFDFNWNDLSGHYSFGHDIEASWLLWEAANVLGDEQVLADVRGPVLTLARTCLEDGMGRLGQLRDEQSHRTNGHSGNSVWWVQAEALVGFLNAWRISGDVAYKEAANLVWSHIASRHIDREAGEWHWMVRADGAADPNYYKVGTWKGPYHNGRAMLQAIRLL